MPKLRYRPPLPGREAWPHIFTYVTRDGVHHGAPPPLEIPYRIAVHDAARYAALESSGIFHGVAHRGPRAAMIDQRRIPS
jgi:hypothetical protein